MKTSLKNLLKELEKTSKTYWNISRETGQFLNALIKFKKYKTVLEVGTSNGYSGIWIAEALEQNKGHLYTIESHQKERFHLAKENFQKSGLTKTITQIAGHAPEDIPKPPKAFDLAFFDATKMEHLSYLKALESRIKKGGMIITDNALSHKKELTSYKKHILSLKNWETEELNIGTGLLISIKTG